MRNNRFRVRENYWVFISLIMSVVLLPAVGFAQPEHDLSSEKVLYAVGTAHLDTQWNWTIQKTINDYIKKTLDDNFSRFVKYPGYKFNFEGAFRYMLMKEYYPDKYATMSDYIDQGRWHITGSTLEQGDMNIVSPESLIRQTLIGNNYFEDEFNKRSTDIYLPDCFGFSYTMPTWMTHCGLNGFSSQKLTWGSSVGIPFNVGVWKGPDGASVVAALNPGAYVSSVNSDLSNDSGWLDRINANGSSTGVFADYKYFGTGDTGGAPSEESCEWVVNSVNGTGPVTVVCAGSDDLYRDITPAQKANLPVYDGELLMTQHGSGCYTSQAAMKRWNRQNELLGDSAERVSVIADLLGAAEYPEKILNAAWIRFLWHSFHDDLTGTSISAAYHFSWNDEILSQNQFATVMADAIGGVSQGLDTQVEGQAVVVYNALGLARQDTVEATITYDSAVPAYVKVFDGATEVPSQIIARNTNSLKIVFLADIASVALKVFDVRNSEQACALETGMSISGSTLENNQYSVTVNGSGDIASVYDKVNDRELLDSASRLELLSDTSTNWPAWEINYADVQRAPYGYVSGIAKVRVVENGPVRVALEVTRTYGQVGELSTFVQKISLAAGDIAGDQVTVDNLVDWRTKGTMVKASFPMTVSNSVATYDLGMGTIQRTNNKSKLHEVPAQQWADITNSDNSYGVSILSDCKYGWDKLTDNQLRLTFLHTPVVSDRYVEQSTLDIGQHKFSYAIAPHAINWDNGQTPQKAARLNQRLVAVQSEKHSGVLGQEYSLVEVDNPQVFIKAVKKAQRSDEIIVRVQELYGRPVESVRLTVEGEIASARLVDGCERYLNDITLVDGEVVFNMTAYQPMTFALTMAPASVQLDSVTSSPIALSAQYNVDAFSYDSNRSDGNFVDGTTFPAELMDNTLKVSGVSFNMGSRANGQKNAVACNGQGVYLGSGYESLYILAASRGGDTTGTFIVGGKQVELSIQDYNEKVVDWGRETDVPYLKNDTVAWVGTHRHSSSGNMAYDFCNLFLYKIDLPAGASSIILPDNNDIVIFAMTKANRPAESVRLAIEVVDSLPYLPALAPKPETRTNLALNKPVTAEGYVGGEVPELAVDGSVIDNSKWCSTGNGGLHWLVVDLQSNYDVDTFVLYHASAGGEGSNWNTRDFCIQTSSDGVNNWEDLVCVEGNTSGVSRHVIVPTSVRYLRLYITDPAQDDNDAVRLYQFNVYGPCDGNWIAGDVSGPEGVPDCKINLYDFQVVAADWLLCNEPMNPECSSFWFNLYPDSGSAIKMPDSDLASLPDFYVVAYWKAQEGAGSILHDITSVDDYGIFGGSSQPSWTTGWFPQHGPANKCLYFNSNGYVVVNPNTSAPSPNLYNLQDAISISAWIKADDWGGNRRILQKGNSDNQYRLLAERGDMVFEIYNVGRIETELPSTGVWHHIAGVYNGSKMKLYIDGVEQVATYASGIINITNDPIYIGTKNPSAPSTDYFKGYMDDIYIYATGLSAPQVRQLASQGQNALPVILDIHKRDDLMTSLMGSSVLDAVVFDVNGDDLAYQWSETSSSPYVAFIPSADVEDPEVVFTQAGDYTVRLAVNDGSGQLTTREIDIYLTEMDATTIKEMNLRIDGDINSDYFIDVKDIAELVRDWLVE